MRRALVASLTLLTAAGVVAVPAQAAPKKPKPITGSYTVQLPPDPSANVFTAAGQPQLCGANEQAQHRRAFTVPAAGTLRVVLDAEDPAPGTPYVFDWDNYVLAAEDEVLGEGTSSEAHEEVILKFKRGEKVVFLTCNLNGQPDAKVSYTFTYR